MTSLLICSDDRALRVLRSVLGELEIDVEHCADLRSAAKELSQRSFGAVIVDCKDERSFGLLKSVRTGQHNSKSMAIAIIEARTNLQAAFKLGANFVVFKPISTEKAKSSFRAARALMKRERRRSVRMHVKIAAYFRFQNGDGEQVSITSLSEGGMAVRFAGAPGKRVSPVSFSFALPDTTTVIEATGTIAWQDARNHAGIQFAALAESSLQSLKEWLRLQSGEKHDPPIRCKLVALSSAACFLRTASPFPPQTRVELLLRAADCSVKMQGRVQLMDPELGMGIEFLPPTSAHCERLQEVMQRVRSSPDTVSEVLVEPEGMDWEYDAAQPAVSSLSENAQPDSLLELLRIGASLSKARFLVELEKYQFVATPTEAGEAAPAEPFAYHRREPRIAVSLPVQVLPHDQLVHDLELDDLRGGEFQDGDIQAGEFQGDVSLDPNSQHSPPPTSHFIDMSHHGARISGVAFHLKPGDVVNLVSDGVEARFLVIWVGDRGTPQQGQIGLQSLAVD